MKARPEAMDPYKEYLKAPFQMSDHAGRNAEGLKEKGVSFGDGVCTGLSYHWARSYLRHGGLAPVHRVGILADEFVNITVDHKLLYEAAADSMNFIIARRWQRELRFQDEYGKVSPRHAAEGMTEENLRPTVKTMVAEKVALYGGGHDKTKLRAMGPDERAKLTHAGLAGKVGLSLGDVAYQGHKFEDMLPGVVGTCYMVTLSFAGVGHTIVVADESKNWSPWTKTRVFEPNLGEYYFESMGAEDQQNFFADLMNECYKAFNFEKYAARPVKATT
jgi:hypothetical protein